MCLREGNGHMYSVIIEQEFAYVLQPMKEQCVMGQQCSSGMRMIA